MLGPESRPHSDTGRAEQREVRPQPRASALRGWERKKRGVEEGRKSLGSRMSRPRLSGTETARPASQEFSRSHTLGGILTWGGGGSLHGASSRVVAAGVLDPLPQLPLLCIPLTVLFQSLI